MYVIYGDPRYKQMAVQGDQRCLICKGAQVTQRAVIKGVQLGIDSIEVECFFMNIPLEALTCVHHQADKQEVGLKAPTLPSRDQPLNSPLLPVHCL